MLSSELSPAEWAASVSVVQPSEVTKKYKNKLSQRTLIGGCSGYLGLLMTHCRNNIGNAFNDFSEKKILIHAHTVLYLKTNSE